MSNRNVTFARSVSFTKYRGKDSLRIRQEGVRVLCLIFYYMTLLHLFKHQGTVKGPPGCDFNPELAAQALRKAFRGLGTDERVLIDVLGSHNNWQRQEIKKRYKVVYGRDLISDLQDELGGHFLEACLALMCPSHVYDARCLRKALASSKADEHCVVEILCTKDCAELELIKGAYTQEFGDALESHLNSLNSGGLGAILKSLISTKREPNGQPDLKECEQDALKLIAAGPSQWLTGVAYLHQLLCLRTPQQLKFIFEAYRRKTKHDIEQEIRKEFEAEYRDGLLALVKITRNLIGYFADRLAECVQASITDDDALIRLLVGRSEIDLQTIKEEFQRKYKKSLAKAIRDECSGDYCRLLLKLIAES